MSGQRSKEKKQKTRAIKETLRSLMVFSGYVRLCGKATPPEGLNLCGPGAGATENKQCLLVIRTSLRHAKSRAQIGFMSGPSCVSNWPKCLYSSNNHSSNQRTVTVIICVFFFIINEGGEKKLQSLATQCKMTPSF